MTSILSQTHTNKTIPLGAVAIEQVPPAESLSIIIVAIVFLSLSWITVILRFWTRAIVVQSLGWDDTTMGISMIFFTMYCTSIIVTASVTSGRDFLRLKDLSSAINWLLTAETFYILTMLVLKISLAIFFLRIMVSTWQKRIVYLAVTLSTLFSTGFFFFAIFQCGVPTSAMTFFIRKISNKCITPTQIIAVSYTHGAVTTVTDITFAVLPLPMLRGSNMNMREKWTVGFILVLGAVGGIASMIRFKFIPSLASTSLKFFADAQTIAIWSTIEPGLGIMAGSLATLRPLFRSCLQRARTYGHSGIPTSSPYGTEKSIGSMRRAMDSQNHVDDETALFNVRAAAMSGLDGGRMIPKEPWKPGGQWQPGPVLTPHTQSSEAIEMEERMVGRTVRQSEVAHEVAHKSSGAPTAAHIGFGR